MRIYSIEVETDEGRRAVKLASPICIEAVASSEMEMPPHFRSLTELLWGLLREVVLQQPRPPKIEA